MDGRYILLDNIGKGFELVVVKQREDEHVLCAMIHKGGDVKNTRNLNLWRCDICCTMERSSNKSITMTTLKGFINSQQYVEHRGSNHVGYLEVYKCLLYPVT